MTSLLQPVLSKTIERQSGHCFVAASASIPGYRTSMEDASTITLCPTHGLFGVFDGHSGPRCASHLAKQLPSLIADLSLPIADSVLEEALVRLDEKYITTCTAGAGGSTASLFIATCARPGQYDVQVVNVGDSRILIGRPKGNTVEVIFASKEHKPDDKEERDRIVQAGGRVVGGRIDGDLAVSRAFGDRDMKKNAKKSLREQKVIAVPDISHVTCHEGDIALVCCDGLLEGDMSVDEALSFVQRHVASGQDLGKVAADLSELAIQRGSKDNVTSVIVLFQPNAALTSSEPEFLPGPYSLPNDEAFKSAYRSAAIRFGMTLDQALEFRKQWVTQRITELCDQYHIGSGEEQPDYALWGEEVLAAILRAEGLRASCDVKAMAVQCSKLGKKEHRVLEPVELRALREELKPKPPAEPPKPVIETPVEDNWQEESQGKPVAPAPAIADGDDKVELPEADDWEDLEV